MAEEISVGGNPDFLCYLAGGLVPVINLIVVSSFQGRPTSEQFKKFRRINRDVCHSWSVNDPIFAGHSLDNIFVDRNG
jgi:hypothetical protein